MSAADNKPSPNEIWDAIHGVLKRLNEDVTNTCKALGLGDHKEIWAFRGRVANQLFLNHYHVAFSDVAKNEAQKLEAGK